MSKETKTDIFLYGLGALSMCAVVIAIISFLASPSVTNASAGAKRYWAVAPLQESEIGGTRCIQAIWGSGVALDCDFSSKGKNQ